MHFDVLKTVEKRPEDEERPGTHDQRGRVVSDERQMNDAVVLEDAHAAGDERDPPGHVSWRGQLHDWILGAGCRNSKRKNESRWVPNAYIGIGAPRGARRVAAACRGKSA
jgi:hypothetical protein